MKKVGLFTIQTYNYGNRLQNYASQYVLEKLNKKSKRRLKAAFFALNRLLCLLFNYEQPQPQPLLPEQPQSLP